VAGLAISAGGVCLLIEMPIMGVLTTKVQARHLIAFGWFCLASAMFYSTKQIDLTMSFNTALWLRVDQVFGMGFLFVPITLAAYIGIAPEKNNSVSGMINFVRNMGSSVGTSIVTTLLARRAQFHQQILVSNVRSGNPRLYGAVQGLSQQFVAGGLDKHSAQAAAYARIYQGIQAQSSAQAYIDTFMVLAVGSGIMFFLSFILKRNEPGGGGHVAVE